MRILKILYLIFYYIIYAVSYVINYRIVNFLKKIGNVIYSSWINARLKSSNGVINIEYPITLQGGKHIAVGKHFGTKGRLRLEAIDTFFGQSFSPEIFFGDNVYLNYDCHIGCINKIVIGNNVLIGSRVLITDHFHGGIDSSSLDTAPNTRRLTSKGAVIIEDNVWIGEGAVIMPNVTIGRNAIIGANAVVTKDVPANAVAAGIPARVIKIL